MNKRFVLYHTQACHLCELAEAFVRPYMDYLQLDFQLEDIADSDELLEQYALSIPVLLHTASQQALYWPFSEIEFRNFLQNCLEN